MNSYKSIHKKQTQPSIKSRLISFYNRHHSNSPILTARPGTSLEISQSNFNVKKTKKLSIISKENLSTKDLHEKTPEKNSLSNDHSTGSLTPIDQVLKEFEIQRQVLLKKDSELKNRELAVMEKEQKLIEVQKELNKLACKLSCKEKDLAKEEEALRIRKAQIVNEVNQEYEKKFRDVMSQKLGLERLLQNITGKMVELNKKGDSIEHYEEFGAESASESRGELDNIDEVSQESSLVFSENGSFEYVKQKNLIMTSCQQLSRENTDITSKIDEILAAINNPKY